ncbi:Gfo/Idh/MocA family oxidoreductase [Halobacillus salinarum]|uniref:Gfo/Idh/MocA family oxidoreductase n=1 Tax=Halobacillus salinarum TaxID=2932257 RepID=A0ABY4EPW9_9BACI|nr:Gfo/Idh/MocA family oxidoreductase [Halobacillus salinarum]UOQ44141.1 Gfo/Idh/MocA family oxidoreductase [Halobacillus salinarum]
MIKVAIIGTGAISSLHAEGYLAFSEKCKIAALVDIYPEKAKALAEKHELNARIFSDYREVLQDSSIDAVSVCTPPYTHSEITVAALRAGKHVLVEKPMASSLHECDEMNAAAEDSGRILSVVAQNRFKTSVMGLKYVLDHQMIGPVAHVQVDSFWWRGKSYYDLWWRGTWEKEGGGCTLNHAVHHIDMLQWMMGLPEEVVALCSNRLHDNAEVEDLSTALLKYSTGALGQITSSVVHHGEEQQLIFQGRDARVSIPWKVRAEQSSENGFPTKQKNESLIAKIDDAYQRFPSLEHEGHSGQISNFLQAMTGNEKLLVDGVQGRKTLELIMAIYEAASLGEKVTLPLDEESLFYKRENVLKYAEHFHEKHKSIDNFTDSTISTGGEY